MKVISKKVVEPRTVYDLRIEDNYNYQITKSNIPVHNSGKGFTTSNLLGIEGKILDVDALKLLAVESPLVIQKAKEAGVDITNPDFKDPDFVYKLHTVLDNIGILNKYNKNLFQSVLFAKPDMKPNLIFDVTLKDIGKFHKIVQQAATLGYEPANIHIVWVINDFEVAKSQNQSRARVVPEDILTQTHIGAAMTMKTIVDDMSDYRKYMDGDVVFAFNKSNVDSKLVKSKLKTVTGDASDSPVKNFDAKGNRTYGGAYVKESNYIYIKRKGKPALKANEIGQDILDKIVEYTPEPNTW